ncbi:hypothetical protein [Nocardia sp. NPDC004722]
MTDDELAIVDLALLWEPFGGPNGDELLITLGMTEPGFRARVRDILSTRGTRIDEPLRRHARAVLRSYLHDN